MSRILDADRGSTAPLRAPGDGTDVADLGGRNLRRGTMKTAALILHDDEPTLALVRGLAESAGFDPLPVSSVYKLVLDDTPVAPRFVVLGITAIDERDLEIVAVLRARWPRAFFLVLFPASLRERAARAIALGADSYLPEPFYAGELLSIAKRVAATVASETTGAIPSVAIQTGANEPTPRARAGGVEQLAAGVAHSIRNPLQILELQLGSVETDGPVDVPGMREQVRRIAGVVESLARFYGRRDVAARPVDVGRIVAEVFGERKGAAPGMPAATARGTSTVSRNAAENAVVLASPELLRAGFEILRNRAARVTPPGGAVEARVNVRTEAMRRVVEIAVTDRGPALSDERRSRLFDPFPDAEGVQDGTGLELAAFAGIVRDHGGSIAALPGGEEGTTILVRLPATDAAPAPADGGAS